MTGLGSAVSLVLLWLALATLLVVIVRRAKNRDLPRDL